MDQASLGMTLASGLAIAITHLLGTRLRQRTLQHAAADFLLFGVLLLLDGIRG